MFIQGSLCARPASKLLTYIIGCTCQLYEISTIVNHVYFMYKKSEPFNLSNCAKVTQQKTD